MLETFKKFFVDTYAESMYITGQAGTGKTTGLYDLVSYCRKNQIAYTVCAYTHKACDVLRSKLPMGADVNTLHSFLEKRPTINVEANKVTQVESNSAAGRAYGEIDVLFVDEFSMIGERDANDIHNLHCWYFVVLNILIESPPGMIFNAIFIPLYIRAFMKWASQKTET